MTGWRAAALGAGVLALVGCGTTSDEEAPVGSGGPILAPVPSGTSTPPGTTPAALETSFSRALVPAGPLDAAPGPLAASTSGTRYQMLLRAADLAAAGPIRALAFTAANDLLDAFECRDVEVRLAHTAAAALGPVFDDNVRGRGSAAVVLTATEHRIPELAAGTRMELTLTAPFLYNGADGLVVEVRTGPCDGAPERTLAIREGQVPYAALLVGGDRDAATGSPRERLPAIEVVFGGGDDRVQYPGLPGPGAPPFGDGSSRRVQLLYPARDVGGEGVVRGVALRLARDTTAAVEATVTVRLHASDRTELAAAYSTNVPATVTPVATDVRVALPAGVPAGSEVWIPLGPGRFTYDSRAGARHLIVDVTTTGGRTGDLAWAAHPTPSGARTRLAASTDSAFATGGTPDAVAYDVTLRFEGGPVTVLTPAGQSGPDADLLPAGAAGGRRQHLFLATEVGTGGTLRSIACRLRVDSIATTLDDLTVRLAHAAGDRLAAAFGTNVPDGTPAARTGPFVVPGGLAAGDWLEVSLATPFHYDGLRNLIVEVSGRGGVVGNRCALDATTGAPRYEARRLHADSPSATSGSLTDEVIDLRLDL